MEEQRTLERSCFVTPIHRCGVRLLVALALAIAVCAQPVFSEELVEPFDHSTVEPAVALKWAQELRKRADEGDADSAYELAQLLMLFGRFGPREDGERGAEWRDVQGTRSAREWVYRAGELGSRPAIDGICRLGSDFLAPADLRDDAKARCDSLRAKFPTP
jgi:hypothetical protein